MDTAAQHKTGRERRTYERLDVERRASQAETLRAAASDLTLLGPMDAAQTAAWLTQRAKRVEQPEPPKPMHPLVFAAFVVGVVLLVAVLIVGIATGALDHIHPV